MRESLEIVRLILIKTHPFPSVSVCVPKPRYRARTLLQTWQSIDPTRLLLFEGNKIYVHQLVDANNVAVSTVGSDDVYQCHLTPVEFSSVDYPVDCRISPEKDYCIQNCKQKYTTKKNGRLDLGFEYTFSAVDE